MTLVRTGPIVYPWFMNHNSTPGFGASLIDATGEKVAWCGPHWNPERATKNIRRVQFMFGGVVKAGGSALTVSLQNCLSATGGAPILPDEVQDETVAIANADSGFATTTWYRTGALSADRTVAFGEMIAVVIEFDGAGRLGADTVNFNNIGSAVATLQDNRSNFVLKAGAGPTWAAVSVGLNVLFEYDDGTFGNIGTVGNGIPLSNSTSVAINTGTTPDEAGLRFQVPFRCQIEGVTGQIGANATSRDYNLLLSDDGGTIETINIDANQLNSINPVPGSFFLSEERILEPNTTYYISCRPTTASSVNVHYAVLNDTNHLSVYPGGTEWYYVQRTDAGAWTATTTRRPYMGIRISALDDGTNGGAATPTLMGQIWT